VAVHPRFRSAPPSADRSAALVCLFNFCFSTPWFSNFCHDNSDNLSFVRVLLSKPQHTAYAGGR
jgi:hypothetical protein